MPNFSSWVANTPDNRERLKDLARILVIGGLAGGAYAGSKRLLDLNTVESQLEKQRKRDKETSSPVITISPRQVIKTSADGKVSRDYDLFKNPLAGVLALAAGTGGLYGGYKLGDYLGNRGAKALLEKRRRKARRDFEKAMLERAELKKLSSVMDKAYESYAMEKRGTLSGTLIGAGSLTAALLGYLAYRRAYDNVVKRDPNRNKLEALQRVSEIERSSRAPSIEFELPVVKDYRKEKKTDEEKSASFDGFVDNAKNNITERAIKDPGRRADILQGAEEAAADPETGEMLSKPIVDKKDAVVEGATEGLAEGIRQKGGPMSWFLT